jgi:lysosomal alpha-mannosidase
VETAFFWKWWHRQSDSIKQDVIDLANNGQLEFTNAAWSQNDEAATNYQSIIDQFTDGLRCLSHLYQKFATIKI